jgi:hypothetical protein
MTSFSTAAAAAALTLSLEASSGLATSVPSIGALRASNSMAKKTGRSGASHDIDIHASDNARVLDCYYEAQAAQSDTSAIFIAIVGWLVIIALCVGTCCYCGWWCFRQEQEQMQTQQQQQHITSVTSSTTGDSVKSSDAQQEAAECAPSASSIPVAEVVVINQ